MKILSNKVVTGLAILMMAIFTVSITADLVEMARTAPYFCGGTAIAGGVILLIATRKRKQTM